jgi:hypothetical protein
MPKGKNMSITTTLKKTYPRKEGGRRSIPVVPSQRRHTPRTKGTWATGDTLCPGSTIMSRLSLSHAAYNREHHRGARPPSIAVPLPIKNLRAASYLLEHGILGVTLRVVT